MRRTVPRRDNGPAAAAGRSAAIRQLVSFIPAIIAVLGIAIGALIVWQLMADRQIHHRLETQEVRLEETSQDLVEIRRQLTEQRTQIDVLRSRVDGHESTLDAQRLHVTKLQRTLAEAQSAASVQADRLEEVAASVDRIPELETLIAQFQRERAADEHALKSLSDRVDALIGERSETEARLERIEKALELDPQQ